MQFQCLQVSQGSFALNTNGEISSGPHGLNLFYERRVLCPVFSERLPMQSLLNLRYLHVLYLS